MELPDDDGGLEDRARRSPPATPSCSSRATPRPRPRCCWPRSPPSSCPPGVLNVVTGDRDTGRAARRAPDPGAGRDHRLGPRRHRRSPERRRRDVKRVHLELGGKAPVVVFDDADIEAAAEGIAVAGYFNAGQDCTAATRVLAAPRHPRRLRRRARRVRQGRGHGRPARRRGRPVRPGQQRQPARARRRASSTGCPTTPRSRPAATARPTSATATSSSRPWCPACARTTRRSRTRSSARSSPCSGSPTRTRRSRWANGVRVRPGLVGVDQGLRPGDADVQARSTSAASGSTPTSRSSPRCRTAASSTVRLRQGPVDVRLRGLHPHQARHGQHRVAEPTARPTCDTVATRPRPARLDARRPARRPSMPCAVTASEQRPRHARPPLLARRLVGQPPAAAGAAPAVAATAALAPPARAAAGRRRRRRRRARRCRTDVSRHREDRQLGQLDGRTSTTTTRPRRTRRSRRSRSRPASRSTTPRTSTTTTRSTPRSRPQLRAGQDIGRDIFVLHRLDGRPADPRGLVQPLDLIRMPNAEQPAAAAQGRRRSTRAGSYSLTWQCGFAGIALQQGQGRPGAQDHRRPVDRPDAQGQGRRALARCATPSGLIMLSQGVDISGDRSPTPSSTPPLDVLEQAGSPTATSARSRATPTLQDLHQRATRSPASCWTGDIFVAAAAETENDNWKFALPEAGGTLWSDNLMVPIASPHRQQRREADRLLLRPGGRGPGRGVGQLHLPRSQGAQEELEKIDPELAENPLIFPTREILAKVQGLPGARRRRRRPSTRRAGHR